MTRELKEKEDALRQKQQSLRAVLDRVAALQKTLDEVCVLGVMGAGWLWVDVGMGGWVWVGVGG
jgi:hypothetical protein